MANNAIPSGKYRRRELSRFQPKIFYTEDVNNGFQSLMKRLDHVRIERLNPVFDSEQQNYHQDIENSIQGFESRLNAIQTHTQEELNRQIENLRIQEGNFQTEIWTRATELLERQSSWMQVRLEEEQTAHQKRINELQNSYETLQQTISSKREYAVTALQDAQELFNQLNLLYSQEQLWYSHVSELKTQLTQSQSNLDNGFEETALAGTQRVYHEMIALQTHVETFMQQRQAAVELVQTSAESLYKSIQRSLYVQAVDLEGNPLPVELDVDYWVAGQLQSLFRQTQAILEDLWQTSVNLTMENIDHLNSLVVMAQGSLPTLVLKARSEALSSQIRFNVALLVREALRTQGYELIYGGYVGSDMRQAYQLDFDNLACSQVFVEVCPLAEEYLVQKIKLQIKESEYLSEYERLRRLNELEQALEWYGLNIGTISLPKTAAIKTLETQHQNSRMIPISLGIN